MKGNLGQKGCEDGRRLKAGVRREQYEPKAENQRGPQGSWSRPEPKDAEQQGPYGPKAYEH